MATTVQNVNFRNVNLGNITFLGLRLDLESFAGQLQVYIEQGSRRYNLSYRDIHVYRNRGVDIPATMTLEWLFTQGNALFDSLIYLANPNAIDLIQRPPDEQIPAVTPDAVARAVFVQFFFILTRGSPSNSAGTTMGTDVPAFLRNILSATQSPRYYAQMLATFNLVMVDPAWVRHINLQGVGTEARNRLGLGVAGYRALSPFRFLRRPANIPGDLVRPYEVAVSMATSAASWDFHPATRNPDLLTRYGPINANAFNLALDLWTNDELQVLVDSRILFAMPVRNPGVTNYRGWAQMYVTPAGSRIF